MRVRYDTCTYTIVVGVRHCGLSIQMLSLSNRLKYVKIDDSLLKM